MKQVLKYGTGQEVPKDAIYLCSLKNGKIKEEITKLGEIDFETVERYFVWHYFLVEVKE